MSFASDLQGGATSWRASSRAVHPIYTNVQSSPTIHTHDL